jgi:hypothetical protein
MLCDGECCVSEETRISDLKREALFVSILSFDYVFVLSRLEAGSLDVFRSTWCDRIASERR